MTSTLKLYKSCMIREEKLFIVDDIESYLSTLTTETISKFQYQRQGASLRLKINKSQSNLDYTSANDYNYASIQNGTKKICYYFIINKKQLADSTIELELRMDTINTFRPSTDFQVSHRTKVNREHKDRIYYDEDATIMTLDMSNLNDDSPLSEGDYINIYTYPDNVNVGYAKVIIADYAREVMTIDLRIDNGLTSLTLPENIKVMHDIEGEPPEQSFIATLINITHKKNWFRSIDKNSEGLTPLLYGKNKGIIFGDNQSWYLIYKGNNPLSCYLCADNTFEATIQNADKEIIATDLSVGTYYYILPDRNGDPHAAYDIGVYMRTAEGKDVSAKIEHSGMGDMTYNEQWVTYYYRSGSDIKVGRYYYLDLGSGFFYVSTLTLYTTTKLIIDSEKSPIKGNTLGVLTNNTATIRSGASFDISLSTQNVEVYDITTLDRTDADIAKIIKLPYRPCDSNYTGWTYDSTTHMLILKNLDKQLESAITSSYNPLEELKLTDFTPSLEDERDDTYESKMFHSDYYQPKFVYDSFTFIFALERQNGYVSAANFSIIFTATGTINSRFLFTFASYDVDGYALEDYSNILPVARNNELPIYNSDYINYVKMGFNYDVKTKQRQEAGQWIGTALSLVGSIASFASSSVTGGVGVAAGISLATATMGQLVNAVNSTAQAEANQAQKLFQLRQQKESVMGSDDIDLMSKYTGNKAKWMLYQVSERMRSVLLDLFYYTGYIDGTNKVPNVTTRKWFNFLSCDLVINEDNNLTDDIINDIKAKYAMGVTFMHCNTINSVKTWDWNQEKENWETAIF